MTPRPLARVAIAGAGPVGLSLASALVRANIQVDVYEAMTRLSDEARASTFHPPTLEMFDAWGVVDDVLAKGRRIGHIQYWDRRARRLVADFDYGRIARDTRYPFRFQCPQSTVTRVLAARLAKSPLARIHFGHAVTGVTPRSSGVAVALSTPEGPRVLDADYLVGADGAKSVVRQALGLGFDGTTYSDRFLLVATNLDLAPFFPGMGPVSYVFDPDEWVIVMTLPDVVRIIFRLHPDEPEAVAKHEAEVRARIGRFLGAEASFAVHRVSVYSVHQRVADTFRVGPVLLAGDAAHINNPAGGMGMNSGIHDAAHLAEALSLVVRGEPDALLDAYAAARRDVAIGMVQAGADKNYRDLVARGEDVCEARNRALAAAAADPALARAHLLEASMLDGRVTRATASARPS